MQKFKIFNEYYIICLNFKKKNDVAEAYEMKNGLSKLQHHIVDSRANFKIIVNKFKYNAQSTWVRLFQLGTEVKDKSGI